MSHPILDYSRVSIRIDLIVIYCADLAACLGFYRRLGFAFVPEQHGSGPEHHAATLTDGTVLELYPAGSGTPTSRVRLGLTLRADDLGLALTPGRQVLRDPDGRAVEVVVLG